MSSRKDFETWGCSDRDLSITLKCETYSGIAWLAWKAATNAMEAKCAALAAELKQSQIDAGCYKKGMEASNERLVQVAAENAGLNNFIAASCFVYAGELGYWPAIDHSPETPATNQLSIAESQFLTDVMTAAGLLSCGKRDKQLAQRLADFCVSKRGGSNPAQIRKGVQS